MLVKMSAPKWAAGLPHVAVARRPVVRGRTLVALEYALYAGNAAQQARYAACPRSRLATASLLLQAGHCNSEPALSRCQLPLQGISTSILPGRWLSRKRVWCLIELCVGSCTTSTTSLASGT